MHLPNRRGAVAISFTHRDQRFRAHVGYFAGGGVAEVLNEGGHAALRGFGELDHAINLLAAEGELVVVALAPCCSCGSFFAGADVAGHVDGCGALGDEFFYSFVESFGVHFETLAEEIGHLIVVVEEGGDAGELGDGGVIAFEEKVVHLAVGEGVEQDGAGGEAIAACAADLLVILLD